MINVQTEGKNLPEYDTFIDECIMALFPEDAKYDLYIEFKKYIDKDGSHAGFCMGDDIESSILAHELVHSRQFIRGEINSDDYYYKGKDYESFEYAETPWEIEAYQLEQVLVDLFWSTEDGRSI